MLVVFGICTFFAISLGIMVKQTLRRKGKLGINFDPVCCPKCGKQMPSIRMPASFSEFLFGGWTCLACGTRLNKWGESINPNFHNERSNLFKKNSSQNTGQIRKLCYFIVFSLVIAVLIGLLNPVLNNFFYKSFGISPFNPFVIGLIVGCLVVCMILGSIKRSSGDAPKRDN
jgi:hypothetical protein